MLHRAHALEAEKWSQRAEQHLHDGDHFERIEYAQSKAQFNATMAVYRALTSPVMVNPEGERHA